MGFLKNIYFDFSFMTRIFPGSKRKPQPIAKTELDATKDSKEVVVHGQNLRDLPSVSRGLLEKGKDETPVHKALPKVSNTTKKEVKPPPDIGQGAVAVPDSVQPKVERRTYTQTPSRYSHTSFLGKLLDHFEDEEMIIHERNVSKDAVFDNLFGEMKSFWETKKDNLKKELENKSIESQLKVRIEELHERELEWQKLKLEHEDIGEELYKKELEIESKITEFKKLYAKLVFEVNVQPAKEFILPDGKHVKSLNGLITALREMDDETYGHHVTLHKNDFANWVAHVIGLNVLATELRKAGNRRQAIKTLENHQHTIS